MSSRQIILKLTLELEDKWARQMSAEELVEYIKERLNSSLGFRGQVKKFRVLTR